MKNWDFGGLQWIHVCNFMYRWIVPYCYRQINYKTITLIGGSRGACWVHTPLWDPILLFSHTFLPKRTCIGGPCPPLTGPCPPPWEILDLPLTLFAIYIYSLLKYKHIYCFTSASHLLAPSCNKPTLISTLCPG